MVYGKNTSDTSSLPSSAWIDVKSESGEGHWVPAEGVQLMGLVDGLLEAGVGRDQIALIAHDVARELVQPEFPSFRRRRRVPTERMAMPEASMHEDRDTVSGKNQVRTTWKAPVVKSKTQPCRMQVSPDPKLRKGVLAADARHHSGSCLTVDDIGHCVLLPDRLSL